MILKYETMKKDILIPEFLKNYHLALRLNHSDNQEYFYAEHDDSYWIYYNFDIILESFETESEIVVGNLHTRRFLASKASVDNLCPHCAFDMSDSNIQQYLDMLWDYDTHDLSSKFTKALDYECVYGDIFLLMSIDIKPPYRGYDLGNAATWIFYRNFCTVHDVIVLLAYPLQFGITDEEKEKCKPEEFNGTQKECTNKLMKYYKKLGFKRIGRSNFMFFNCENIMNKPKILDSL